MKLEINIEKRHIAYLVFTLAVLTGISYAIAQDPYDPGHPWGEIDCLGCIDTAHLAPDAVTSDKVDFFYAAGDSEGGLASGDIKVDGDLNVTGHAKVDGNLDVNGDLNVTEGFFSAPSCYFCIGWTDIDSGTSYFGTESGNCKCIPLDGGDTGWIDSINFNGDVNDDDSLYTRFLCGTPPSECN